MYCCSNCFIDKFLKKYISENSGKKGKCSFCNTVDTQVINPNALSDLFQPVVDLYKICSVDIGMYLDEIIQLDWNVFTLKNKSTKQKLLIAIFNEPDLVQKKYQPRILPDKNKIIQWNEFREELKHINRYFPKKIPDQENLGRLFGFLKLPDNLFPEKFYRARINKDNKPYSSNEMKKPPEVKVPNGRANPVGIPYFYIASDIATAIAEVRPYKGETVTIACLTMKSSLSLVDLRNPKQTLSPFEFDDDDLIRLCTDMSYLILLGEELSKPILPSEAELEYLPSQYLCEFVKNIGFHGIIYKSSLAHGDNYAIFDHKRLKCIGTENYKVTDTEVKAEKYKMKD